MSRIVFLLIGVLLLVAGSLLYVPPPPQYWRYRIIEGAWYGHDINLGYGVYPAHEGDEPVYHHDQALVIGKSGQFYDIRIAHPEQAPDR